ncbi:MAG: hypothetical protein ACR65R_13660 [Methylomicrobium sp.]
MFALAEMHPYRTRHRLHFLLSLLTFGLWVFVWLAISIRNTHRRNQIARDYRLPAETNIGYFVLCFLFILFSVGGYVLYTHGLSRPPTELEPSRFTGPPAGQQTLPETRWVYAKEVNPNGLGTILKASTYALNEIEFGPPDEGKQQAVLVLRKNFDNSHAVYLGLQKGRFLCNSTTCGIDAQFDNGLVQFFEASPVGDSDMPGISISEADIFIELVKAGEALTISSQFVDQPAQVFHFDIRGLRWE